MITLNLNNRKEQILTTLIKEHFCTTEPVGSELILEKCKLNVRSATIRNELAEMEDMGLLEQPHVSSGRVPADLGYRYFVDHLISIKQPAVKSREKLEKIIVENEILNKILVVTTETLAKMSGLLSIATLDLNDQIELEAATLSEITLQKYLIIFAFKNGHIENRMIHSPRKYSHKDISLVSNLLLDSSRSQTLKGLHAKFQDLVQFENSKEASLASSHFFLKDFFHLVANAIEKTLQDFSKIEVIFSGKEYLFSQPESKRPGSYLEDLIKTLENKQIVYAALNQKKKYCEFVIIGKENHTKLLYPFTFIKQSIYVEKHPIGTLALMGPKRLNYQTCIPLLNYAAQAISENLSFSSERT